MIANKFGALLRIMNPGRESVMEAVFEGREDRFLDVTTRGHAALLHVINDELLFCHVLWILGRLLEHIRLGRARVATCD
jgi:hypothetical protein